MSGWPEVRKAALGLVVFLVVLSWLTPAVPMLVGGWCVAAAAVRLWPDAESERWEPFSPRAFRAARVGLMRSSIWYGLKRATWRLAAAGDNDGAWGVRAEAHPEQEPQPRRRAVRSDEADAPVGDEGEESPPRLIAVNSVAAMLAAVAAVGLEMLLAAGVGLLPWTGELRPERWGPVWAWVSSGRSWVLLVVAAPLGWMSAKTVAHAMRVRAAAKTLTPDDGLTFPQMPDTNVPTAFMSNSYLFEDEPSWRDHVPLSHKMLCVAATVVAASAAGTAGLYGGPVVAAGAALTVGPIVALLAGHRMLRGWCAKQREPWVDWREEVQAWEGHWDAVLPSSSPSPVLADRIYLPAGGKSPPMVKQMIFAMSPGVDYERVRKLTDQLKPALSCDLVQIFPGTVQGTREPTWSYIFLAHELAAYDEWVQSRQQAWTEWQYDWNVELDKQVAFHDPTLDADMRRFLLTRQMSRTMTDLGIGILLPSERPQVRSSGSDAPAYIRFAVPLYGKTTFAALKQNTHKIAEQMRCEWLRFGLLGTDNVAVAHMCAVHPDRLRYRSVMERNTRMEIEALDWQWWMETARLFGADGTTVPKLVTSQRNLRRRDDPESELRKLKFRLPPGLTAERLEENTEKLTVASDFPFVAVEREAVPSEVTVIAGRSDPLDDTYHFDAARKVEGDRTLIAPAVPGAPQVGWCLGVGVDGDPIVVEWDHEEPHLLIAGASGSGKSMVINSMLSQLMGNNDPADVELWMLEPKNELQRYMHKRHVRVFIDNHVAEGSIYEVAANTFETLVAEMDRRYTLMHEHPRQPQKISEAREIAAADPAGSAHLAFRYLFCVVEECTSYFGKPATPDDKAAYVRMNAQIGELARKSRASGIHLVFATQNPTKDAIPTQIKRNCRRIGLRTSDRMGSMVIIDKPGLETIAKPGRGLVSGGNGYIGYRAWFMELDTLSAQMQQVPDSPDWPKLPPGIEPAAKRDVSHQPVIA